MKVKELIAALKTVHPESEVIIQKDAEGNNHSPLADVYNNAVYIPRTTWYGDVFYTNWSADDAGIEQDEWERLQAAPRCVVLCPIN